MDCAILRNILSNWTSYLVTAAVGFLLAPVVVHSLGNTGYGLWTLVLSMTGYFGLLDLGIRSSVGRFVTRYLALNDEESVNRTVSTAFVRARGSPACSRLLATGRDRRVLLRLLPRRAAVCVAPDGWRC